MPHLTVSSGHCLVIDTPASELLLIAPVPLAKFLYRRKSRSGNVPAFRRIDLARLTSHTPHATSRKACQHFRSSNAETSSYRIWVEPLPTHPENRESHSIVAGCDRV